MDEIRLDKIRRELAAQGLDGWLFYDFRLSNPIAYRVLGVSTAQTFTRRWYYWVPAQGSPRGLVSALEANNLKALPGDKLVYKNREEMAAYLAQLLEGSTTVAMEYSPMAEVPVVAKVDAGTVELVRSLGKTVVSSGDLVQAFEAVLTPEAFTTHLQAEERLATIMLDTIAYIQAGFAEGRPLDEYIVQQHMMRLFDEQDLFLDHGPIVAVGPNASNPHYEPRAGEASTLNRGDLLLIDWWGKLKEPGAIYADYTYMMALDSTVDERYSRVFDVVRGARDEAIRFVADNVKAGNPLEGWQVDDVTRHYIEARGYGEYFLHRTGHSIGIETHGSGANMDNFETHDTRRVLPSTLFSIEPGIYLPEFGVRSEVNVYVGNGTVEVTGRPVQETLPAILA